MTRADIGKAEIPAAPTIGLTFLSFGRKRLRIFAVMTPPAVSRTKAMRPMPMMASVPRLTNLSPVIAAEIEKPRSIVTMLAISFCAACERRSVTPLTRSTLPNMTKPSSATEAGAMRPQGLDDRRLDERDERHVCVGRYRNRPQQVRREARRNVYRGRAVGGSDDAYRGGLVDVVVENEVGDPHREEDTGLRRKSEEEDLRVREQRREVAHGSDRDEYQQREYLRRYAEVEEHLQSAVHNAAAFDYLVERRGKRKVDEYRAEAHRQQQVRLKVLLDGHVHKEAAHTYHYQALIGYSLKGRHK